MFGVLMKSLDVKVPKKGKLTLKTGSIVRIIGLAKVFDHQDFLYYLVQVEPNTSPILIPINSEKAILLVVNEKDYLEGLTMKNLNGFEKLDLIRQIKYEELIKKQKEEKDKEETKESGEKS